MQRHRAAGDELRRHQARAPPHAQQRQVRHVPPAQVDDELHDGRQAVSVDRFMSYLVFESARAGGISVFFKFFH